MNGYPVKRNTLLLASSLAALSGMLQLGVAVATTSLVLVTGIEGILGLGPAIFLVSGAVSALPAGRLMDRFGRVPVLAGGFGLGVAGCLLTALACGIESAPLLILGFVAVGSAMGIALLARTAAGDMYPPERRARGISLVLFGAVFGAILGPTVFSPLFSGRDLDAQALVVPWLVAAGIVAVGLALVLAVRPDPSLARAHAQDASEEPAAPLPELLRRPGVPTALLGALASFAVMVAVMNLTGYMMVGQATCSRMCSR
jgi:MFS family permease